jgi:hypothetical protein
LSIARFTMAELHRLRGSRAKRRLNGKADLRHKGAIAVSELDAYVAERGQDLTNGDRRPIRSRPTPCTTSPSRWVIGVERSGVVLPASY